MELLVAMVTPEPTSQIAKLIVHAYCGRNEDLLAPNDKGSALHSPEGFTRSSAIKIPLFVQGFYH